MSNSTYAKMYDLRTQHIPQGNRTVVHQTLDFSQEEEYYTPAPKTPKKRIVTLVGNGPLSDEQRKTINNSDEVIRCNDFYNKNFKQGDKVDTHAVRHQHRKYFKKTPGLERIVIPHKYSIKFKDGSKYRHRNISTGMILVSILDNDDTIDELHIYGMNSNFRTNKWWQIQPLWAPPHSHDEIKIMNQHCNKCTFHKTSRSDYV